MQHVIDEATRRLSGKADGVLVRQPFLDPVCPETSDLDLLAFARVDDLYPERYAPQNGDPDARALDITWLPLAWLDDPAQLAARGLIAHRLVSSRPLFWRSTNSPRQYARFVDLFFDREVQARRLSGFLEMASLTVREIGVTWDFPALAMFWLHMAYAACLAAAIDGSRRTCSNVFTQPFASLRQLGNDDAATIRRDWIAALQLDQDPSIVAAAVSDVHALVAARFPEPEWPGAMRETTRFEYRYWLSAEERTYRLAVAAEMTRGGDPAAAVYYLRFYAYALARLPMVHACALEGRDVSFLRPEQAVLPSLRRLCPQILPDLNLAFAGPAPSVDLVQQGLATLEILRMRTLACLRDVGISLPAISPWRPFERTARPSQPEALCRT